MTPSKYGLNISGASRHNDCYAQDLACKTIGELWFPPEPSIKSDRSLANGDAAHEAFNAKVSVILGVVAKFPDRQSPLEDLLHQV